MATPERAQRGFVVVSQYRHYFTNWVWLQHVACQERTAGFNGEEIQSLNLRVERGDIIVCRQRDSDEDATTQPDQDVPMILTPWR